MEESTLNLARACKRAMAIHSNSYNHGKAKLAAKKGKYLDSSKLYEKTLEEACDEAAEETGFDNIAGRLLYLAIDSWWNDVEHWADYIIACSVRQVDRVKVKGDCGHVVPREELGRKYKTGKWICFACLKAENKQGQL